MYRKKKIKKKKVVDPNRPNLLNHEKRMKEYDEKHSNLDSELITMRRQQAMLDRLERVVRRQGIEISRLSTQIQMIKNR
jgi:hypothetical protein